MNLTVREFTENDIEKIVDYFINSETDFLKGMGAEKNKLPQKDNWLENLKLELTKPYTEKKY